MNHEHLTHGILDLVRDTGHFILSSMGRLANDDILEKDVNNLVTWVDKQSEARLVDGLQKLLPHSGFILEENTITDSIKDLTWIVDPLDGTTNYVHGVPLFCISISLMKDGEQIIGVVSELNLKETFYAWKGGGCWMNGNRVTTSATTSIGQSLLATGFPYYDYSRLDEYIELFRHLMQHSHGIRRLGSAAADLAYVACGRYDGFYEYGLSPWDVAAGSLLVTEAGGRVADFKGGDQYIFGKEILAFNPHIFESFLSLMKNFFK